MQADLSLGKLKATERLGSSVPISRRSRVTSRTIRRREPALAQASSRATLISRIATMSITAAQEVGTWGIWGRYDAFGRLYAAVYCEQVFRKSVGVSPVCRRNADEK